MLYAILCYDDETAVEAAPTGKIDAVIAKRRVVTSELAASTRNTGLPCAAACR